MMQKKQRMFNQATNRKLIEKHKTAREKQSNLNSDTCL